MVDALACNPRYNRCATAGIPDRIGDVFPCERNHHDPTELDRARIMAS